MKKALEHTTCIRIMKAPLSTTYIVKTKFKYTASREKPLLPPSMLCQHRVRAGGRRHLARVQLDDRHDPADRRHSASGALALPCVHAIKRATALSVCLCSDTPQAAAGILGPEEDRFEAQSIATTQTGRYHL